MLSREQGDLPMPRAPLALAALLCLAAPGRADWVTLGFAGVADYASGADLARLGLSAGAAVSGTVRYQTSSLPEPALNDVAYFAMPGSVTVRAGGHSFTAAALGPPHPWLPRDPADYMRAAIRIPGIPWGRTYDLQSLELSLSGAPLAGEADHLTFSATFNRADGRPVGGRLPADPGPFAGGAGSFYLTIYGPGPGGQGPDTTLRLWLTGTMVGVSAAPEPGALALAGLGAGAGLLAWARRRLRGRWLAEWASMNARATGS
jgi:PEP-CTERM motif